MNGFRREAILSNGSEVWIGPSFGIIIRPDEDAAVEIAQLEERLRRKTLRVPGPYSGT